jgi:hypothetical protein
LTQNPHKSEENSDPDEPPDGNRQLTRFDTIEDGTEAFMQWMGSADKKSLTCDNPIVLTRFINDVHAVLYDTSLSKEIEVRLASGIPYCSYCKSDDCAHIGFTICVEQLVRNGHIGNDESIEEIITS